MSVEATALSRSKLEQKDRAELAAIVEAMGGKATSRAKKADLVDLVLDLAGAPTDSPVEGNGNGNAKAKTKAAAAGATAPVDPPEPAATNPRTDDVEPPAEWEGAMPDDPAAADATPGAAPDAG